MSDTQSKKAKFPWLEAISSGVGLLGSIMGGNSARGDWRSALEQQNKILAAQEAFRKMFSDWMEQQRAQGFYDPKKRMEMLSGAIDRTNQQAIINSAVPGRIMGYAAGDSPMKESVAQAIASNQNRMADLSYQVYQDAHDDEVGDFEFLHQATRNPEGLQAYGNMANAAYDRMGNASGGLAAAIQAMGQAFGNNKKATATGGGATTGGSGASSQGIGQTAVSGVRTSRTPLASALGGNDYMKYQSPLGSNSYMNYSSGSKVAPKWKDYAWNR